MLQLHLNFHFLLLFHQERQKLGTTRKIKEYENELIEILEAGFNSCING